MDNHRKEMVCIELMASLVALPEPMKLPFEFVAIHIRGPTKKVIDSSDSAVIRHHVSSENHQIRGPTS